MAGEDIWVEVEVQKGTLVSVYRGRMERRLFDAWHKGELAKGAVPIQDTYWSYDEGDGNEGWVVVGSTPGPYASAVGTTWVRADLILVIVQLRDGSERETHKLRPARGGRVDA